MQATKGLCNCSNAPNFPILQDSTQNLPQLKKENFILVFFEQYPGIFIIGGAANWKV